MQNAYAVVRNSLLAALILIASACEDRSRNEFVVSDSYALCTSTQELVSISLKDGVDATKGDIWIGRAKAQIVIDAHPYYPSREKLRRRNEARPGVIHIDSGRYRSALGPEEREFNLSTYRLEDGRNMFVVLSGASSGASRESLMKIQSKLCVCGSC